MKRFVAVMGATTALTSGCGGFAGLSDVPLPGGADLGDDAIVVTVEAEDVLSLSRQSAVKVDDVTVGEVRDITLVGWHAEIELAVDRDVELPANAVAAIRQTGLLGEKYVELASPTRPRGELIDGARIELADTTRSVEVEEVLGALSLLLNGGGLERIRTITVELNKALGGREDEFRGVLDELNSLTGTLAANKQSILDALDGLDRLSEQAADGHQTIARALDQLGPAVEVLADQRRELVHMLEATSDLAHVTTRTVVNLRQDLLANLHALRPTLASLADAGESIPGALQYALTFPFPTAAMSALKGDYFNFDLSLSISELGLLGLIGIDETAVPPVPAGSPGSSDATEDPIGDLLNLTGLDNLLSGQLAPGNHLSSPQNGPGGGLLDQLLGGG